MLYMICRLGQSEVEDELQQEEKITIWMDKNNYPFFQKISKGGKVTVNDNHCLGSWLIRSASSFLLTSIQER